MALTSTGFRLWPISNWRIGFRLTLFFLLLTLVPIELIGLFVVTLSRNALLAQGTNTLQSASQATAREIDAELTEQREFIRVIGLMPDIARYVQNQFDPATRDAAQRVLTAAVEKSADYDSVAIINRDGTVILSSLSADVGTDVRFRPEFQEALRGANYVSDPSISIVTGSPAIFYSAPIKNDAGIVLAVIRSQVKIERLWTFVERDDGVAGPSSFGLLLDKNGLRLAHSSSKNNRKNAEDLLLFRAVAPLPADIEQALVSQKRLGRATESRVEVMPIPEVALRLASEETSVFETRADTNSARNQAVMVGLQNKPWRYLVAAPLSTFTATADRTTLFIIVLSVIVAAAAFIIALVLSRSITRPIVHLSKIADRMSLGELDVKIEVNSGDEVGELAEALRRMQVSLRAAIKRLSARRTGT